MEPRLHLISSAHASLAVLILSLLLDPLQKLLAHAQQAHMEPITVLQILALLVRMAVPQLEEHMLEQMELRTLLLLLAHALSTPFHSLLPILSMVHVPLVQVLVF